MVSREDAAVPGDSAHHHGRVGGPSPVREREFQDAHTLGALGCHCLTLQWPTRPVLRLVAVLRVPMARIGSQLRLIWKMPIIERRIKTTVQLSTLAPIFRSHVGGDNLVPISAGTVLKMRDKELEGELQNLLDNGGSLMGDWRYSRLL